MNIYEQLVKDYDAKLGQLNKGEEIDKLSLGFLGCALDAVDTSKRLFNITLDFSAESIETVEKMLAALHTMVKRDAPTREQILNYAKVYAAYIGQVMILQWGGEWREEKEYQLSNGPALHVNGQHLFLLSKVFRRLVQGQEENVWHYYQTLNLGNKRD